MGRVDVHRLLSNVCAIDERDDETGDIKIVDFISLNSNVLRQHRQSLDANLRKSDRFFLVLCCCVETCQSEHEINRFVVSVVESMTNLGYD